MSEKRRRRAKRAPDVDAQQTDDEESSAPLGPQRETLTEASHGGSPSVGTEVA